MSQQLDFGHDHYVPILKTKAGELRAVRDLNSSERARLTPLLEVPSGDLAKTAQQLEAHWGADDNSFIQALSYDYDSEDEWIAGTNELFDRLHGAGLRVIPTAWLDDPAAEWQEVSRAAAAFGLGACIRIDAETFVAEQPGVLEDLLDAVLAELGLDPQDVDLLVDVGAAAGGSVPVMATLAADVTRMIPDIDHWRTLTHAFSAFPGSLAHLAKSSTTALSRDDAHAWHTVDAMGLGRRASFGDYAVGTPVYASAPYLPVPSIRYAVPGAWMVYRAHSKTDPSPQYVSLAAAVRSATHFGPVGFCAGDVYIDQVASGSGGPGNATTWLQTATNRHIAVVVDAIGSGHGP